jgi:hypothetical protein
MMPFPFSFFKTVGSSLEPETIDWLAQATPQPSNQFIIDLNNFIISLKSFGIFSLLDRLWIHATEYQQHARVSIINPTSPQSIEYNSPTWTPNVGYTGDGSSMYIDLNYNIYTDGVNYTQNNALRGLYSVVDTTSSGGHGSYNNSVDNTSYIRYPDGYGYFGVNSTYGECYGTLSDSLGLFTAERTSPTIQQFKQNGIVKSVYGLNTNTSIVNIQEYLLAINIGGGPDQHSTHTIAITLYGSGNIDTLGLYSSIQAFATARGFNV